MNCPNCNYKITPDKKYCERCGTFLNPSNNVNTLEVNKVKSFLTKHKIKIILGLVIVCIVSAVIYFNSVTYLEKKLTKHTWYAPPNYSDWYSDGYSYTFYSNGEVTYKYYENYNGSGWYEDYSREYDWEILDDKTLYWRGDYYRWKDEWHLTGNKLIIEDSEYYNTDKWSYE